MERKLVSVQRVDHLEPIAGADNILKARVMGWDVVVKKGEFAPGDPCVFFEIDSLLPEGAPWAEFMRPRGFRVKTARLQGELCGPGIQKNRLGLAEVDLFVFSVHDTRTGHYLDHAGLIHQQRLPAQGRGLRVGAARQDPPGFVDRWV